MSTVLSPVTATDHWAAAHGVLLFDTAIGRCGIAWAERGVVGVQLPEGDERRTQARLLARGATKWSSGKRGKPNLTAPLDALFRNLLP